MSLTILDKIAETRRARIDAEKAALPLEAVKAICAARKPAIDVRARLANWPKETRAIIAEFKRKSPSKGDLAPGLDPAAVASSYEKGGALAISCLVEPDWFGGGLADLDGVRGAVSIPVLYKDFIIDPYQLWQARAHGADMALLIAALLGAELGAYLAEAERAGITVLVEVHDEEELKLAVDSGSKLIGVNNRNLKTFAVDLAVSERLIPTMPAGTLAVAESGIATAADMGRLEKAGARAFLIGETLVKAADPGGELQKLARTGR